MTTAHHPSHIGTHRSHEWILVAVAAIIVAVAAAALVWGILEQTEATPTLPDNVTGFEYTEDATTGHLAQGAVTGEYYGNSGVLYPALMVPAIASGFEYETEATPIHLRGDSVTSPFIGVSGDLDVDK